LWLSSRTPGRCPCCSKQWRASLSKASRCTLYKVFGPAFFSHDRARPAHRL
jgi:hypothetical protein